MSEQENATDLSSLDSRVAALRTDMDAAVGAATKKRKVSIVMAIVAVLVVILYMTFIRNQFDKLFAATTINKLADIGDTWLNDTIDSKSAKLIAKAKSYAPELAVKLETQVMGAPEDLSKRFRAMVKDQLEAKVKEVEPQLIEKLKEVLAEAQAKGGTGGTVSQAELNDILKRVSEEIIKSGTDAIAQMRKLYHDGGDSNTPGADQIIGHLNYLVKNQGLSEREKHQRKIFRQTLAVVAKYHQERGDGG